jgi:hypothetical protein
MSSILHDITMERDQQELSLGDTLDVKAGILLALIAVLATISGTLLSDSHLERFYGVGQMVSLCVIAVGAFFAVWTLIPRNYWLPGSPITYEKYLEEMELAFSDNPGEGERQATVGITKMAAERVQKNHEHNADKSRWLTCAFVPVLIALTIDLATLVCLAAAKILS